MGVLSDRLTPRTLMVGGGLLGAFATQLFGLSGAVAIFFVSRLLEGMADAAGGPAVLSQLTCESEARPALRARAMSVFELTLLAGLALGGLAGRGLWSLMGQRAFGAIAGVYGLSALMMGLGAAGSRPSRSPDALAGLRRALRDPVLLRLAPAWLCMNVIVALWLGPAVPFPFTAEDRNGQYLTGLFAAAPEQVGFVMLGFAILFAAGIGLWSVVLPRMSRRRVLCICLVAMGLVCL
jgi:MFS family permease